MPEHRGSRFAAEALFLVALAVALALAHLNAIEIAGAMLVGWMVVALLEWAAWRREPHYGSGLPPRYYLPTVGLPPSRPLEQVDQGYPDSSREDAPTWIASPALRAEVLGTWPLPAFRAADEEDGEPEPAFASPSDRDADPWTVAALPKAPFGDAETSREAQGPSTRRGAAGGKARYNPEPLLEAPARRRLGRRAAGDGTGTVDVPARPSGRALPSSLASRARRTD